MKIRPRRGAGPTCSAEPEAAAVFVRLSAFHNQKHPDFNERWSGVPTRARNATQQQGPLTAEYELIFERNLAELDSRSLEASAPILQVCILHCDPVCRP